MRQTQNASGVHNSQELSKFEFFIGNAFAKMPEQSTILL